MLQHSSFSFILSKRSFSQQWMCELFKSEQSFVRFHRSCERVGILVVVTAYCL